MISFDASPFIISGLMGLLVTLLLLIVAFPLGYLLSNSKGIFGNVIEALITLPMVLPPTVLGFYFLMLFSPRFSLGQFLQEHLDISFVFSFKGIVLASCIHSLPFMVQPLKNGFQSINRSSIEASYTLGRGRMITFWSIVLPELKPFLLTGVVMTFMHTLGEFGVILMVGGAIPGVTRVASIAIYESVEQADFHTANIYSLTLVTLSIIFLFLINIMNRNKGNSHA